MYVFERGGGREGGDIVVIRLRRLIITLHDTCGGGRKGCEGGAQNTYTRFRREYTEAKRCEVQACKLTISTEMGGKS